MSLTAFRVSPNSLSRPQEYLAAPLILSPISLSQVWIIYFLSYAFLLLWFSFFLVLSPKKRPSFFPPRAPIKGASRGWTQLTMISPTGVPALVLWLYNGDIFSQFLQIVQSSIEEIPRISAVFAIFFPFITVRQMLQERKHRWHRRRRRKGSLSSLGESKEAFWRICLTYDLKNIPSDPRHRWRKKARTW